MMTRRNFPLLSRKRLAEAHLRVPQHLVLLLEAGQRPVNRIYLLFTEYDRLVELQFATGDDRTALLHCGDRRLDCLQVRTEPLTPLRGADELVRKAGVFQDGMDLLVSEVFKHLRAVAKGSVADGELGVQQLVFDARRLGLLVDACAGRVVQRLAVRRELVGHKRRNDIRIANLEIPLVLFVVYGIDVNQLVLERLDERLPFKRGNVWLMICHHLTPFEVLRRADFFFCFASDSARAFAMTRFTPSMTGASVL